MLSVEKGKFNELNQESSKSAEKYVVSNNLDANIL
jgi:hypothetical protein